MENDDAMGRTESIGPDVNTSIPAERIASDIYLPAYGMPRGILSPFYTTWRREIEGLTVDAGRPMTRAEYEAWSRHLAPRTNIVGGGALLTTAYLFTIPFSIKVPFPMLSKGPTVSSVFPSPRMPWIRGRTSRALWKTIRGAYILTLSTCTIAFLSAFLKRKALDVANRDKTLASYWSDRQANSLGLLEELNLGVVKVHRQPRNAGISIQIQRRDESGRLGEPETGMSITELLALRTTFNDGLARRAAEGTWHRTGREGREGQAWQQEQQFEQREQEQSWQDQDHLQDGSQGQTSWDSIRASANAAAIEQRRQRQQQQNAPMEASSFPVSAPASSAGTDNPSPWSADTSLDDASPVAPGHRDMGTGDAPPAKTWDQIRQENWERTQQRQQQRQQQQTQQPPQPQSQQQQQQQQQQQTQQGASSWDTIRSRNQRRPEEDHTYTEEQRSRETAKQQAQEEFDKMIERERTASGANDPGRKW